MTKTNINNDIIIKMCHCGMQVIASWAKSSFGPTLHILFGLKLRSILLSQAHDQL
jgi:hypothetical protein